MKVHNTILKNIIKVLLLVLFSINTYGQTEPDSLLSQLKKESSQKNKFKLYKEIIKKYQNIDINKAINYTDSAIIFFRKNNLKKEELLCTIAKARIFLISGDYNTPIHLIDSIKNEVDSINDPMLTGRFYLISNQEKIYTGEFEKAMELGLKSIFYLKKANDYQGLAAAYKNIGYLYNIIDNRPKALDNFLQSKKYALKTNDTEALFLLDNNIGTLYEKMGYKDQALQYYYKLLEYANNSNQLYNAATACINIGLLLTEINRYEEALSFLNKAKDNFLQTNSIFDFNQVNIDIGNLYLQIEQFDSAEYYLTKSYQYFLNHGDKRNLTKTFFYLAQLHNTTGQTEKAVTEFNRALKYAKYAGILEYQKKIYKNLSALYAKKRNFSKAYLLNSKALVISDSIISQNRVKELKHFDFQIKFKQQASKYEEFINEYTQTKNSEIEKEKKEKYIIIFLLILTGIVLLIIYYNFKVSRNINKKLAQQNRKIENQKELIEISNLEIQEQYAFSETLLNTIPNPVFYTDKNFNILGCNTAFIDVTGKSIDELAGTNIEKYNLVIDKETDNKNLFKSSSNKIIIKNEGAMLFSDGTIHNVICYRRGIIDANNTFIGILGIIIDITDLKKTEKKLLKSEALLKEALISKDKFFNIMAHDLKNPFNAILGLTSIISDDFESHTEDELKEYVKLINDSASKIYNLLENLLEWARAQSGTIERTPVTFLINEVIQESIHLFEHSINQKNINIENNINKEIEVFADKNMIMTIIRNLLSNAIKFTPDNGNIKINVEQKHGFAYVSVNDNGIGIDEKNIDKLFKIDNPLSTPGVNNEKGTGLGLIITHEFVKQNDGDIFVDSTLGKGTTFTFTIPLKG